jgi:hypothetical protein
VAGLASLGGVVRRVPRRILLGIDNSALIALSSRNEQ